MTFQLKLKSGTRLLWDGRDGETASRDYELSHPGTVVVAWRSHPRHGLFIGLLPISEPLPGRFGA